MKITTTRGGKQRTRSISPIEARYHRKHKHGGLSGDSPVAPAPPAVVAPVVVAPSASPAPAPAVDPVAPPKVPAAKPAKGS